MKSKVLTCDVNTNQSEASVPRTFKRRSPWICAIWASLLSQSVFGGPIRLSPSDLGYLSLFGQTMDVSGQALVVGVPSGDVPAAYVYRDDGTTWNQEQTLYSPFIDGQFGRSVAISDDALIVGETGRAYFYRFNGSAWDLEQTVTGADVGDFWGSLQVGVEGDTAAIGIDFSGLVYLFRYSLGVWNHTQTLDLGADYVTTVALRGNLLAVGAYETVSVFRFDGTDWLPEAEFFPPGFPASGFLGYPLAIDGATLMFSSALEFGGRAVQVYTYDLGAWMFLQEIRSPEEPTTSSIGSAIAVDGDLALLGGWTDYGGQGAAWLYHRCGETWVPERFIPSLSASAPSFFGYSVMLQVPRAFIAAPNEDNELTLGAGAVYILDSGTDCNENGMMDGCERIGNLSLDCEGNLILDVCEPFIDCNGNSRRDACDLAKGASEDCNHNQTPDECDVASGNSTDDDGDGLPDECFAVPCENPAVGPLFSLKAAAKNGQRIPPVNEIRVAPGDQLDAEVFVLCWGSVLDVLRTYQSALLMGDGAESGAVGTVLPLGWDAPFEIDFPPCDDPFFPIYSEFWGQCVGPDHDPELGAYFDFDRPDYVFYGYSGPAAVDVATLERFRFGATSYKSEGPMDEGFARYGGTLRLEVGDDACGTFTFEFLSEPGVQCGATQNLVCDAEPIPYCDCPEFESLVIQVCQDDGQFCNGTESCDPEIGCRVSPPPNCDDGVACTIDACDEASDSCTHVPDHSACDDGVTCTVDACDEATDSCTHVPDHAACDDGVLCTIDSCELTGGCGHFPSDASCDDGDACTRDECAPGGCVHIDELCGEIPTISQWGLTILALALLTSAKLRFRRRLVS